MYAALEDLPPPEQYHAVVDLAALLLASHITEENTSAIDGFLEIIDRLLPGRVTSVRRQLIEAGAILP